MMKISGRQSDQKVYKIDANPDSDNRWGYTGEFEVVKAMPYLNFADSAMASDRAYFGMFIKNLIRDPGTYRGGRHKISINIAKIDSWISLTIGLNLDINGKNA